jgi:hypothetical protein
MPLVLLVDILRVRRTFSKEEATLLLSSLPAILDRAVIQSSSRSLFSDVYLSFRSIPRPGIWANAVGDWPAYQMLLKPPAGAADETAATMEDFVPEPVPHRVRLAALIFELLGGAARFPELVEGKFSPLSGLDEAGNLLLKSALMHGNKGTCEAFWSNWIAAIDVKIESRVEDSLTAWQIPTAFLSRAQHGHVLDIATGPEAGISLRFVARSAFRIGRSQEMADLPLGSTQSGNAGEKLIREIGRIHVVAERVDDHFAFRDGDGNEPSVNGTLLNGKRLSPDYLETVAEEATLEFGRTPKRSGLKVKPLTIGRYAALPLANVSAWKGFSGKEPVSRTGFAGLSFTAQYETEAMIEVVWLFSGIGVSALPDGGLSFSDDDAAPWGILYRHGSFWLLNGSESERCAVGGAAICMGQAAPLLSGQELSLGGGRYLVNITA